MWVSLDLEIWFFGFRLLERAYNPFCYQKTLKMSAKIKAFGKNEGGFS